MKSVKKIFRRLREFNFPQRSNFQVEKLVFCSDKILVRHTLSSTLFNLGFFLSGIFALWFTAVEGGKAEWVGWLLGVLFTLIGAFMLVADRRRPYAYIDLQKKLFYITNRKRSFKLEKVSGVAVLAHADYRRYHYELGLIVNDRFYRLYAAPGCGIFYDGARLAKALDLPWRQEVPRQARKYNFNMIWGPLIFGCLILFNIPGGIVQAWSGWLASRNYVAVPAVIQKCTLTGADDPNQSAGIDILYEYRCNNQTFQGRQYSFFHRYATNVGANKVRQIVKNYTAGQQTECYVNPAQPQQAVLDRKFYLAPLLIDYIFCLIGIACLRLAAVMVIDIFRAIKECQANRAAGLNKN